MKHGWICALLALLLLLPACGGKTVPPAPEEPEPPVVEAPEMPEEPVEPEDPLEAALQAKLEEMRLEQKVGQLFFVRCPEENAVEDVATYHLGGYILFNRDTKDKTANELIQTIASYQRAAAQTDAGLPLLIGVDEEGGTVVRVSSNPNIRSQKFSSPQKLLAKDSEMEAVDRETEEKSLLLKALGFNVNLAPVADVSTDPSDFIYDRTTGGDSGAAFRYASRVVQIQSSYGLGSVLKHFPGYGNNKDTHTGVAVDDRPLETFQEQDFLPFQETFAMGNLFPPPPAVLVCHNIVNCMDPNLPASLSPEVHRILREDLGFDGVVMTDDLAMDAVTQYAEDGAVAELSLQAGNDLVVTSDYRAQIPRVITAVKDGTIPEEIIDEACLRVLRWKVQLGLLECSESGTLEAAVLPQS